MREGTDSIEEVEIEIIIEEYDILQDIPKINTTGLSLKDLQAEYDVLKKKSSDATSELGGATTLKGLDSISEIVAKEMLVLEKFVNNGKKDPAPSVVTKAIAFVAPNNKWAKKWITDNNQETEETLMEQTMEEIADKVLTNIGRQREKVMTYMESIVKIRDTHAASRTFYEGLLTKANALLTTLSADTREDLDTKSLINRLTKSIVNLDSTISSDINPLIASANLAIQEIDNQLPDIEHDLKYSGSLKVAQQSLADFIGIARSVKTMTETAGDTIRKDIQATTLQSIELVGEVMIDTDRMKQIQKEEQAHMLKLDTVMNKTKDKINKGHEEMKGIHTAYLEHKNAGQSLLIENYSK